MSAQPLTYEGILDLFRKSDERFRQQKEESDRQMKELRQQMGDLGLRVGNIVEQMIGGKNVVEQFQDLGYDVNEHSRNIMFGEKGDTRQIDLMEPSVRALFVMSHLSICQAVFLEAAVRFPRNCHLDNAFFD